MSESRLIKKISNYLTKIKVITKLVKETREDMREVGIITVEIWNKEPFWIKADKFKVFKRKTSKKAMRTQRGNEKEPQEKIKKFVAEK